MNQEYVRLGRQLLADALWAMAQDFEDISSDDIYWFWRRMESLDPNVVARVFEKLWLAYLYPEDLQREKLGYSVPQFVQLDEYTRFKNRHKRIVQVYHHSLLSAWIRKAFCNKRHREEILIKMANFCLALA